MFTPNNIGRFTIEHRVSKDVAIPSTNQVKGSHSDVVKIGSFSGAGGDCYGHPEPGPAWRYDQPLRNRHEAVC